MVKFRHVYNSVQFRIYIIYIAVKGLFREEGDDIYDKTKLSHTTRVEMSVTITFVIYYINSLL